MMLPNCSVSRSFSHPKTERGGLTNLADLALLCTAHHTSLHRNNLRLERTRTGWSLETDLETDLELRDTG